MRLRLQWDVLFVLEEDDLRRAPDAKHYQLAQQLRRTLVTMDRDYLDDRRFPPVASGGVLVIHAPGRTPAVVAAGSRRPRAVSSRGRRSRAAAAGRQKTAGELRLGPRGRVMVGVELLDTRALAVSVDDDGTGAWRARSSTRPTILRRPRNRRWSRSAGRRRAPAQSASPASRRIRPASAPVLEALAHRYPGPYSQAGAASSGTAAAVAEAWVGAGRGVQDLVYFAVGEHTIGGIVRAAARPVTGAHGRARVGGVAGAQSCRARGLSEDRLPRSRSRRRRHRPPADLAHQVRRSVARAGSRRTTI